MFTKAQCEFTKSRLCQIIPFCAVHRVFIKMTFYWMAMAMVFLHNREVWSWLYHEFSFLRNWVHRQDLMISLSLKNLCQGIRMGWDLCPGGSHQYSELFAVISVTANHSEFQVVTNDQEWHFQDLVVTEPVEKALNTKPRRARWRDRAEGRPGPRRFP